MFAHRMVLAVKFLLYLPQSLIVYQRIDTQHLIVIRGLRELDDRHRLHSFRPNGSLIQQEQCNSVKANEYHRKGEDQAAEERRAA